MKWLPVLAACLAAGVLGVDYDVVVYGSTPAGIAAATAAGQLGLSVAVYEPLTMIGGMGAAGALGLHDGDWDAGTGLAQVFMMLNAKAYNITTPVPQPESFVAEASFFTMLHGANVTEVKTDCHVTAAATEKGPDGGSRIASITLSCLANPVTATVFIDASYDGDVMVAAGDIPYTWGREANTTYNESLAGARVPGWTSVRGPTDISALSDDGTPITYVYNLTDLGPPGTADDALMAFQHRMCISDGDDMVPWPKPDNYNPDDFTLIQRVLDATGNADAFTTMPPGRYHGYPGPKNKYDLCCGITVAASDQPTLNKGWANASWERRQEIVAEHTYFELGTFYYLANDPRVPAAVRKQFSAYGPCKDEFVDNNHVPVQLYVRISNRLVGDFVLTQNNIGNPRSKDDSIAKADWFFDNHMTGKYAVPDGKGGHVVTLEGNYKPTIADACPNASPSPGKPNVYDVPYRSLLPRRGTGGNLLVPVCLSTSAVAYASTRIESMFMYVGTAAGVAAKQVVDGEVATVQDVNVTKVQTILTQTFKQAIHCCAPSPSPSPLPPYYNVTGAGSASWNGQYVRQRVGDQDLYTAVSSTCSNCQLYASKGVWRLAIHGKELMYVASGPSEHPPLSGWVVANGSAPAPTLSAGMLR